MEITAAYTETRIKTYGFQTVRDLVLFAVTTKRAEMASLGLALCQIGEMDTLFHLAFAGVSSETMELILLIPRQAEGALRNRLDEVACKEVGTGSVQVCPAELVFFHGPHFGDRSGIVHAALKALADHGIGSMGTACSGSCVFIVLADGQSDKAVRALSEIFEIPRVDRSRASSASRA